MSTTDPEDGEEPRAPLTTTTSIKPAASVLLIAVVTLGIFALINTVLDSNTATTTTVAVVGGLPVDTNSTVLAGCQLPGIPPEDVASGLIVPIGTSAAGPVDHRHSDPGSYDCSRDLGASVPQSKILGFYLAHLEGLGWHLFSQGPAARGGGQQLLFQKAGSDTFYWIEGVTVISSHGNATTWTLRLYQNNSLT